MTEDKPIRVLVVDDHAIIRKGVKAVLDIVPDIELVGEAENGKQATKKDLDLEPDVILMDLMMPEMDGIACIREIKAQRPEAHILVLTNFAGEDLNKDMRYQGWRHGVSLERFQPRSA